MKAKTEIQVTSLPPLNKGVIDLHFNGVKPPRGKTTWGLVIDLQGSQYRWNLNAEKISHAEFVDLAKDAKLPTAQQERIAKVVQMFDGAGFTSNPHAYMMFAFKNLRAGKPGYKLRPDYDVLAILDVAKGAEEPVVALWWGDDLHILDKGWTDAQSPNRTIVGRLHLTDATFLLNKTEAEPVQATAPSVAVPEASD